jgi:hypothetical protein
MILFVVAIAVGIGILNFSESVFSKSRNELNEFGQEDRDVVERVITVPQASAAQVAELARQCAQEPRLSRELCFVVNAQLDVQGIRALDGTTIPTRESEFTVRVDVADGVNAVFIYYDPLGTIEVNS